MKRKAPVLFIVMLVWLVFSVIYVGYTQYRYFTKFIYQRGRMDAVVQVIQRAQKCEAFPVQIDNNGVQLINTKCLQQMPPVAEGKKEDKK